MRLQLRFSNVFRILLALLTASALGFPGIATAAISIDEIDPDTVSGVEGTGTATVIYGGVAGDISRGTCPAVATDAETTCDSCEFVANGDTGLVPCNKRRIHPNARLHIRISSSDADGYPIMTVVTGSAQTEVTSAVTKASIGKGTVADLYFRWSEVCSKLGNSACTIASGDEMTSTFKIGIDKDNTGQLDATDDSTTITIKVRDGIAVDGTGASLTADCGTDPVGLCYFEVKSGDQKMSLVNLSAVSGFPLGNNTTFKYVRVLFEQRTDPNGAANFTAIHPGSTYVDLEVGGSTGAITLTPNRVVGLTNDETYDVKVAVVDVAGNTGYYSPLAQATLCDSASSTNPGTGVAECHVARPSEVVGILSEQVNCFVATAAYGSPLENEVSTFRAFRDRFLSRTYLGKKFVIAYYHYGPKAAKFISANEMRRSIARAALAVPLAFSKFALREGGIAAIALLSLVFGTPLVIALFAWARRKRGARA
ncbi:MAG: CFI-box-CTERM domain-containing protein [Bdellovibrionota bacterium]